MCYCLCFVLFVFVTGCALNMAFMNGWFYAMFAATAFPENQWCQHCFVLYCIVLFCFVSTDRALIICVNHSLFNVGLLSWTSSPPPSPPPHPPALHPSPSLHQNDFCCSEAKHMYPSHALSYFVAILCFVYACIVSATAPSVFVLIDNWCDVRAASVCIQMYLQFVSMISSEMHLSIIDLYNLCNSWNGSMKSVEFLEC